MTEQPIRPRPRDEIAEARAKVRELDRLASASVGDLGYDDTLHELRLAEDRLAVLLAADRRPYPRLTVRRLADPVEPWLAVDPSKRHVIAIAYAPGYIVEALHYTETLDEACTWAELYVEGSQAMYGHLGIGGES